MSAPLFNPDDFHDASYLVYVARLKLLVVFIERAQDYPPGVLPRLDIDGEEAIEVLAVLVKQLVEVKLPLDYDVLQNDSLLERVNPSDEACRQLAATCEQLLCRLKISALLLDLLRCVNEFQACPAFKLNYPTGNSLYFVTRSDSSEWSCMACKWRERPRASTPLSPGAICHVNRRSLVPPLTPSPSCP